MSVQKFISLADEENKNFSMLCLNETFFYETGKSVTVNLTYLSNLPFRDFHGQQLFYKCFLS